MPERLSHRNDFTLDKENFSPDIRQNIYFEKIRASRVYMALETNWSYLDKY